MLFNTLILSRAQFGFTIGFHILFPTLNIGLGVFLCIMEAIWLKTKNPTYRTICQFWTKIFALTFGMGVVSGIVLSYELGTNFGRFIEAAGGVLGPLFAYEVLSAFFLEAGFLGVMLFGWNRVRPGWHFLATLLVTIGTLISAFWIMSANSWMQTPAGFHIEQGKYVVTNWLDVIFNPSFLPRFFHMITASFITAFFVVAGVSAYYLLKQRDEIIAKTCFSLALTLTLILTIAQVFLGDKVGVDVFEQQPLKTAAIEGVWDTQRGAPLLLFAVPDTVQEKNHFPIGIPYGASLINTHQLQGELIGLKTVSASNRPVIVTTFFAFRVMVGIGLFLLAVSCCGMILRWRKKLYSQRWFFRLCIFAAPLGFISSIAGWLTAESGRQPWVAYHLMKTMDGASQVPPHHVMISFLIFLLVYGIVFSFYLTYLFKLIHKGPQISSLHPSTPVELMEETPFKYLTPEKE